MNNHRMKTTGWQSAMTLALVLFLAASGTTYLCGDVNDDASGPDITDLIYLVTFMFQDGPEPPVMASVDVDGNGTTSPDIADLIYLVAFMFQDGPGLICSTTTTPLSYPIVGTGQIICFDNTSQITCPQPGASFYGQDACHMGNEPAYQNNGDSTITDLVTGLMWQKSADMDGDGNIDADDKVTYDEAVAGSATYDLAGHTDWRLPTIKELYSLILFSGLDPSGYEGSSDALVPFIDTAYFDFGWGDEAAGERVIDAQYVSSTLYDTTTMINDETDFGVNFADGRIKGYGLVFMGSDKTFYVKYVRGNTAYGLNDYTDNGDGTITDSATGLTWQQGDSETGLNWEQALDWVQSRNAEGFLGHDDWRLPSAKELQSIVDYDRAPLTTGSAAIDPLFNCSQIPDEDGGTDYPYFWSGTTHENMTNGSYAAYVSFGQAFGWMQNPQNGQWQLLDVHGAGAQRSDPKIGDPADWPYGHGPQGDVIRIYNYVRLVRDAE